MSGSPWLDSNEETSRPLNLSQYMLNVFDLKITAIFYSNGITSVVCSCSVCFKFASQTENRYTFVYRLIAYHFKFLFVLKENIKMAVSYVRIVLLYCISSVMLQNISCDLACETKRCDEIQWEGSALALNIPQLCSLIENSSAVSHDFLRNQQNDYLHEIKNLFQNHTETLMEIADTQTQIAHNTATVQDFQQQLLIQQSEDHDDIKDLFQRQTETLAQMANAFDQVVALLQMQSQELKNMSTNVNKVMSVLENQQETLENISRSLPAVLEQQANQTELLSQCQLRPKSNCPDESNRFQTMQATKITTIPTKMTSTERVTQDTTTLRSGESPIQDCSDLVTDGHYPSGIYTITPTNGVSFDVYCDMDTADGGWTVFQKKVQWIN